MAKIILLLVAICLNIIDGAKGGGRDLTNLEIRRQLKRLNKPAVKSIKSEDGDIIDCVDIYKQPAFDHPLLKNHTIQMRPTNYNSEKKSSSKQIEQVWHKSGSCPEGTIPITRTRKSDLIREISMEKTLGAPSMESAKLYAEVLNHGGQAIINIWNIYVEEGESSTASIFVGIKDKPDLINGGWIVSDSVFGDNKTRVYVFWASDNGGCYDLKCPGFIQTDKSINLAGSLTHLSVYGGDQYAMYVKIFKDQVNDNWWFQVENKQLGYWPGLLFKDMKTSADIIQWGGQVWNSEPRGHHTNTQMGSGHFSKEGHFKAAYIRKILYFNLANEIMVPNGFPTRATIPSCYDISPLGHDTDPPGAGFYYGGPGGTNCDG